ncbi:MAG: PAS domain-containing protein, partial [Chrysiogenetes bacterium]|nr:PAS domain-containing protein [Chrysiogenetes bacterium]
MTENFFQSIEFANLLDVLALLSLAMALPLLLSGLHLLARRTAALFLIGYAFFFVSLSVETWQSTFVLFHQYPVTPPLYQYLNLLFELLGFWLVTTAVVEWINERRSRSYFWSIGVLVLVVGGVAGLGGIQRSALLPVSFIFRPEAELFFVAMKLVIALVCLGWVLARAQKARRLVVFAALMLVLRQSMELAQTQDLPAEVRTAFEALTHFAISVASVSGALALSNLDEIGVRARVFRVLLFGFVALSTVSVALSFNYLLRDRLLGEALGRYRGEAAKITSDVHSYLERLDRQVKSLATMELYSALAYPADPVQALASIPHQFLLEDFKSVGFYTTGGEVLHVYAQPGTEPALQSLDRSERERLLNSSGGSIALNENFLSHGSLFYEFERQLRIRGDRPENQPEILFAAVVRDAGGQPVGYVEALFPTSRLTRFFRGYAAPGAWDFIASGNGLILAHGNDDYVGYDVGLFGELFGQSSPEQRWYRINLPGGSNYVVTERVPGRDWVVARVISTGTMLGALRKLRGETLVILVVTLTVTLFVALVVSNFVNRQRITLERMALELDLKRAIEGKNIELSVERQRIETILLSLGEGVIVLDAADRIMFANRIAELMLQKSSRELIGTQVAELHIDGLAGALERMVAEGDEEEASAEKADKPERARKPGIEEFVTRIGELDVRGNAAPIVREGEPDQGCVIIFQDISEL